MFPELIKKIFAIQFKKSVPSSQQEKKKSIQLDCFEIVHDIGKPMFFPDCYFYTQ